MADPMRLTALDLKQLASRGLTPEQVQYQIELIQRGSPFADLDRPCVSGDGIKVIGDRKAKEYIERYDSAVAAGRVMKLVPASGAGSRMFGAILSARNRYAPLTRTGLEERSRIDTEAAVTLRFFENLHRYAFFPILENYIGRKSLEAARTAGRYDEIADSILNTKKLNYANKPKGLLPFHGYGSFVRTPIEEHILEAVSYASDANGTARVHFTVSPEHLDAALEHIAEVQPKYESSFNRLEINCSSQKIETDTIAVDQNNRPFRTTHGISFRPGGHGALLENLNDLEGDIVLIKNIDNVTVEEHLPEIARHKKILGGYLIETQNRIFTYLDSIASGSIPRSLSDEIIDFISGNLGYPFSENVKDLRGRFIECLNRPLRVCGMVRNTGAPGGAPFWVHHKNGSVTPQIIESAQVDPGSKEQQEIWYRSTHFNPVDLACGVRDHTGKPFDLLHFRDPDTGFISNRWHNGQHMKAMELPGLWNGGMAHWNTIFVEVPKIVFASVKSVEDLLKFGHLGLKGQVRSPIDSI